MKETNLPTLKGKRSNKYIFLIKLQNSQCIRNELMTTYKIKKFKPFLFPSTTEKYICPGKQIVFFTLFYYIEFHKIRLYMHNQTWLKLPYSMLYIILFYSGFDLDNFCSRLNHMLGLLVSNSVLSICHFSTMHTTVRSNCKDWLAWNQDNVSEWNKLSIQRLLFQWDFTIKIQLSMLVYKKTDIILLKCNLSH
jgi:hypothetical protein